MKQNMGTIDKLIRLAVVLVILILYFVKVLTGIWSVIFFIIAAIFILTSIFGICPLYLALRISTAKKEDKK